MHRATSAIETGLTTVTASFVDGHFRECLVQLRSSLDQGQMVLQQACRFLCRGTVNITQRECEQHSAASTTCLPAQGPSKAASANGPDSCVSESLARRWPPARRHSQLKRAVPYLLRRLRPCRTGMLGGGPSPGAPCPPPPRPGAGLAPVGGGGGRGREELPRPPRTGAAAKCPAPAQPVNAVAHRRVVGVGTRPQRRPAVRGAGDPHGGGAAGVGPPPGAGAAALPQHARGVGKGGCGG